MGQGYELYGNNWQKIADETGLDRSATQIYKRIARLKHKVDIEDKFEKGTPNIHKKRKGDDMEIEGDTKRVKNLEFPETYQIDDEKSMLAFKIMELSRLNEILKQGIEDKDKKMGDALKVMDERTSYSKALLEKSKHELKNYLIETEKKNREMVLNKVSKDSVFLGQIGYERQGASFMEVWKDGSLFSELNRKKLNFEEEMRSIDVKKKNLSNKRRQSTSDIEHEDLAMQESIVKIRSTWVKQRLLELDEEKKKLTSMKHIHIKELRRLNDEQKSSFNDFRVLKDRYILLHLLGKGGFSEVYRAYDLDEFRQVACKIHQLNPHWPEKKKENYTRHACREYNIHKSLNHSSVVKLYDVFEIDCDSFCTVLEYCGMGDLDSHLKKMGSLNENEAKVIMVQLFKGLRYLNEQKRPIIHYDLKPGNILFSDNGGIKITDFGLSKIMEEDANSIDLTSQGSGTYWYLPPECFDTDSPRISSKVDVWSAGVIFYQMLFGEKPFGNNMSQQKILQQGLIDRNLSVAFPQHKKISLEAKSFIQRCLTPNQELRPDIISLSEDPYLLINPKKSTNLPKFTAPQPTPKK